MAQMHPDPRPVVPPDVTTVFVIIIAVAAPFSLGGYHTTRCRPENSADCGAATSTEGAAYDGAKGAAE